MTELYFDSGCNNLVNGQDFDAERHLNEPSKTRNGLLGYHNTLEHLISESQEDCAKVLTRWLGPTNQAELDVSFAMAAGLSGLYATTGDLQECSTSDGFDEFYILRSRRSSLMPCPSLTSSWFEQQLYHRSDLALSLPVPSSCSPPTLPESAFTTCQGRHYAKVSSSPLAPRPPPPTLAPADADWIVSDDSAFPPGQIPALSQELFKNSPTITSMRASATIVTPIPPPTNPSSTADMTDATGSYAICSWPVQKHSENETSELCGKPFKATEDGLKEHMQSVHSISTTDKVPCMWPTEDGKRCTEHDRIYRHILTGSHIIYGTDGERLDLKQTCPKCRTRVCKRGDALLRHMRSQKCQAA
ncbi:hypothetical protein BKA70DRAFT_1447757 [Coprinopsis sp. MPI-PUGE-AT-0042]|nr:hypothetical protein BKA70DRAFT_1447757 [Coprinopsis sp. MPI-PUGE-AT-0042]